MFKLYKIKIKLTLLTLTNKSLYYLKKLSNQKVVEDLYVLSYLSIINLLEELESVINESSSLR